LIAGSIIGGSQVGTKQNLPFVSAPSFPTVSAPSSFFKQPSVSSGGINPGLFFSNPSIMTSAAGSSTFGDLSKNVFAQQSALSKQNNSKKNIFGGLNQSTSVVSSTQSTSTTTSSSVFNPPPSFSSLGSKTSDISSAPQQLFRSNFQAPSKPPQINPEELRREKEKIVQAKTDRTVQELLDKYIKAHLYVLTEEAFKVVESERKQREQKQEQQRVADTIVDSYAAKVLVLTKDGEIMIKALLNTVLFMW